MNPFTEYARLETRRHFFGRGRHVLGYAALSTLLGEQLKSWAQEGAPAPNLLPHFAPKAKRVIYLHMVGGPSQMDL